MHYESLKQAAEQGHPDAQLQMGIACLTGDGAPAQDVVLGRQWLSRAAENGQRDAARFLGMIYLRGMDVEADFEQAERLLQMAAAAGDPEAARELAGFVGGARDEHFDPARAMALITTAAEGGSARAMAHLGFCLFTGSLADADPVEGMQWYARAAAAGDGGAMLALAEAFEAGCLLPRDPNRALGMARAAQSVGWPIAADLADSIQGAASADTRMPPPADVSARHTGSLPSPQLTATSWAPRVISIRHFLTAFECAEIIQAANAHLMPSIIVDQDGRLSTNQTRTSNEVRLRPGIRNIVTNAIERKMAAWSQFPVENGELPLVLRYEPGQSFEQHFDYFIPEMFVMGEGPLELGGQRVATQLVYLNDRFSGGETRFDNAGISIRPERGLCIIFHNLKPDHNVDPLTRHTGVAVERGVKWVLSRWIREIPADQPARGHVRDRYKAE
jgi:prolyl 4-hydroxylase